MNVSLTPTAGEVIVGAFLMNTARTTQIHPRATAKRVIVALVGRTPWRAVWNYPITGGPEERV